MKSLIVCLITTLLLVTGCKREDVPTVETADASSITRTAATCGGQIISQGDSEITERGIFWSTSDKPTISDNKEADDSDNDLYSIYLTGLDPDTEYFVRAFAINSSGTGYGETKSFTTEPASIPEVKATRVSGINVIPIIVNGMIIADGASQIIDRGFCWDTSWDPTISDNFISFGVGTDPFSTTITMLDSNSCYFVRAYAINLVGTAYSENTITITPFPTSPYYPVDSIFGKWQWVYSIGGIDGGYHFPIGDIMIDEYSEDSLFVESMNGVKSRECKFSLFGNVLKYIDIHYYYRVKIRGENLNINIIDTLGSIPIDAIGSHYFKSIK